MAVSLRTAVYYPMAGFMTCIIWWGGSAVHGQPPAAPPAPPVPPPVPAPAAQNPPGPIAHPAPTYDSLQAGSDAQQPAEEARGDAIRRQLGVQGDIRRYNTWLPAYGPPLPAVYGYGSVRAARRAYRSVYGPPLLAPWPRVPGDIYGYPYYPWARQPIGHEKIWTSPNGYIYKPLYPNSPLAPEAPALPQPQGPTRADPATRPRPAEDPPRPQAVPAIPEPPPAQGPREL